ncbi:asparagine synthetase domain-containing protein 1-like, partial [Diaphorina citri]|uniref:Asparagine synthetase domain-containing protein 1-like n=1 Tax=Diaphorina citri TaxID=121845 RepID=A0A3Q0JHL8_DIACI
INISRRELEDQRHCHIKDVIYPLDTVLDDSLGCAVWFAARGVGRLGSCGYTSSARRQLLQLDGLWPWCPLTDKLKEKSSWFQINISRRELEDQRHCHIKDVIYPLDTVLDDSLGCAVWFAARGVGRLGSCDYTSPARVLLLGMGADELLGGYTRHRTILRHCGNDWSALRAQLEHEVLNISRRNLGRDNRVVCDHGRQSRTPFLDEPVVAFLLSLPSWQRCWITDDLPPSVGDKLLLRLLAWKLGLKVAASLPKRALQFGSRIANSREKGNAVCDRLQS